MFEQSLNQKKTIYPRSRPRYPSGRPSSRLIRERWAIQWVVVTHYFTIRAEALKYINRNKKTKNKIEGMVKKVKIRYLWTYN